MLPLAERLSLALPQFKEAIRQAGYKLRVAEPGIIQSFDPVKQTVVVQLALQEVIVSYDATTFQSTIAAQTIPLLSDVPIIMPRGGPFVVTFPVEEGDECLVIFGDMCIDSWWQSGGVQQQAAQRRHNLSDGFALFGPWSQPKVLSNYSTSSAQLRSEDGTVVIDVSTSEIKLTAPNVSIFGLQSYPNNAAAVLAGLTPGQLYQHGDLLGVVY